jgi:hypothetical protein
LAGDRVGDDMRAHTNPGKPLTQTCFDPGRREDPGVREIQTRLG